jgi:hypothetical protein
MIWLAAVLTLVLMVAVAWYLTPICAQLRNRADREPTQTSPDPKTGGLVGGKAESLPPSRQRPCAEKDGTLAPVPPPSEVRQKSVGAYALSGPGRVVADEGRAGPIVLRAASVIGQGHAAEGSLREDAYGYLEGNANQLLLCVADGLSSARNSHVSSAIAARVALEALADPPTRGQTWPEAATHMMSTVALALDPGAVDREAARRWTARGHSFSDRREPATTLTLGCLWLQPDGSATLYATRQHDGVLPAGRHRVAGRVRTRP